LSQETLRSKIPSEQIPAFITSSNEYKGDRVIIERRIFAEPEGKNNLSVDIVNFPIAQSVAILSITKEEKVLIEKHYRYAPLKEIMEIPAGWLKDGEQAEDGAKRELMEETGYSATNLRKLGSILPAPGYSTEEIFLFFAKVRKSPEAQQRLEPTEKIIITQFSKSKVLRMIKSGQIKDSMTISAIYLAQMKGLF
jgi:ADP-ribose pyrophosphatase